MSGNTIPGEFAYHCRIRLTHCCKCKQLKFRYHLKYVVIKNHIWNHIWYHILHHVLSVSKINPFRNYHTPSSQNRLQHFAV